MSVALSGGGHRASLFGLGALMYLADAGENHAVTSIASVSGGSITNGYVARKLDFAQTDGAAFREAVKPLVRILSCEGTFQSSVAVRPFPLLLATAAALVLVFLPAHAGGHAYYLSLAAFAAAAAGYLFLGRSLRTGLGKLFGALIAPTLAAALAGPFLLPGNGPAWTLAKLLAVVFFLLAWLEFFFGLRGRLCLHCYRRTVFRKDGSPSMLADVRRSLDHIFCCTEQQSGDHFYLAPGFVYGFQLGAGKPQRIDVASAVQASTALPGAFPPQRRKTAPLLFSFDGISQPPPEQRPAPPPRSLSLVDGGVYDNMAEQWASGFAARASRWTALASFAHPPKTLVVVNASAEVPFQTIQRAPTGFSEIRALLRDIDILYDQTTAQRRVALVDRFDRALASGKGLGGVLVHIAQSPYRVPKLFQNAEGEFADRAPRARAALQKLHAAGVGEDEWRSIAREDAAVETTLAPIGPERGPRLIWHGFVLSMVNMHVVLDTPLLDIPRLEEFQSMLTP